MSGVGIGIRGIVTRVVYEAKNYIRSHDESGSELPVDFYQDNPYAGPDEESPRPLKRWLDDSTYQRPNKAMAKILSGDPSRTLLRRVLGSLPADWTDWSAPAYSETLYSQDDMMITGDIIGAWTFQDMQDVINLAIWRPIPLGYVVNPRLNVVFAKLMPYSTAAMNIGDRDKLNSARPTRTRFYPARIEAQK